MQRVAPSLVRRPQTWPSNLIAEHVILSPMSTFLFRIFPFSCPKADPVIKKTQAEKEAQKKQFAKVEKEGEVIEV